MPPPVSLQARVLPRTQYTLTGPAPRPQVPVTRAADTFRSPPLDVLKGMQANANANYETTKKILDQVNGLLSPVAPALTPTQIEKFIGGALDSPQKKQQYAEFQRAQTSLANITANNIGVLSANNPKALANGLDALTASPKAARKFVETLAAHPEIAARLQKAFPNFMQETYPRIVAAGMGDVVSAAAAKNPATVPDQVKQFGETSLKAYGAFESKEAIKAGVEFVRAADGRTVTNVEQLLAGWKTPGMATSAAKILGATDVFLCAWGAADSAGKGDYLDASIKGLKGVQRGAQLALAASFFTNAAKAAPAATALARIAPGVGIIAGGLSIWQRTQKPQDVAQAFGYLGDLVGMGGNALEFTPFAPLGTLISGAGSAISTTADVLHEKHQRDVRFAQTVELLVKSGATRPAAVALARADPELLDQLRGLGLSAQQVMGIAARHPAAFEPSPRLDAYSGTSAGMQRLVKLATERNWTPADVINFLDGVEKRAKTHGRSFEWALNVALS